VVKQELTCGVDLVARETEALKLVEKAPVPEKQGAPEDAPLGEENKVSKDGTGNVEEDKVYIIL
jgi:plasminogen activator inhibitor 1 RNA-binding protein